MGAQPPSGCPLSNPFRTRHPAAVPVIAPLPTTPSSGTLARAASPVNPASELSSNILETGRIRGWLGLCRPAGSPHPEIRPQTEIPRKQNHVPRRAADPSPPRGRGGSSTNATTPSPTSSKARSRKGTLVLRITSHGIHQGGLFGVLPTGGQTTFDMIEFVFQAFKLLPVLSVATRSRNRLATRP